MSTKLNLPLFAAITATMFSISSLGHAQTPLAGEIVIDAPNSEIVQSQTVSYADLNLRADMGRRELVLRIRQAAKNVCAPLPMGHEAQRPYAQCVDEAVRRAFADVRTANPSDERFASLARPAR